GGAGREWEGACRGGPRRTTVWPPRRWGCAVALRIGLLLLLPSLTATRAAEPMTDEVAARATGSAEAGASCGEAISTGASCRRCSGNVIRVEFTGRPLINTERGTTLAYWRFGVLCAVASHG